MRLVAFSLLVMLLACSSNQQDTLPPRIRPVLCDPMEHGSHAHMVPRDTQVVWRLAYREGVHDTRWKSQITGTWSEWTRGLAISSAQGPGTLRVRRAFGEARISSLVLEAYGPNEKKVTEEWLYWRGSCSFVGGSSDRILFIPERYWDLYSDR